jgi:hypothetical protein
MFPGLSDLIQFQNENMKLGYSHQWLVASLCSCSLQTCPRLQPSIRESGDSRHESGAAIEAATWHPENSEGLKGSKPSSVAVKLVRAVIPISLQGRGWEFRARKTAPADISSANATTAGIGDKLHYHLTVRKNRDRPRPRFFSSTAWCFLSIQVNAGQFAAVPENLQLYRELA